MWNILKRRYLPAPQCLFCSIQANQLPKSNMLLEDQYEQKQSVWGKAKMRPGRHSALGKHSFIPYHSLVPFCVGTREKFLVKPHMTQCTLNVCSKTVWNWAELKPYRLGISQSSLCGSIPGQPWRCDGSRARSHMEMSPCKESFLIQSKSKYSPRTL